MTEDDILLWKLSDEARHMIEELDKEIANSAKELEDGSLLLCKESFDLVKQYAYQTGYIEGLKFIKNKITVNLEQEDVDNE